jgi:branched-chain amino acid transport system permease protein
MALTEAPPRGSSRSRVATLWQRPARGAGRLPLGAQIVAAAAVLLAGGFWVPNQAGPELLAVLSVALCYVLLALGTNIVLGWSGLVSFGQAAFFGAGAYTVALAREKHWAAQNTILLALVVAAVLGYVSFYLLSHYTHIAFAMLTLVFGQFVVLVVSGTRRLGATDGFGGILREPFFGSDVITDVQFWWLVFGVLLVALAVYWWLFRRVLALRMFAGREDAGRMETLGYDVRRLRAAAGSMSAVFCAAGGALYAQYTGAVSPTVLQFELSGIAVFMCVIGGMRYLWGPLVGALLYTLTVNYWLQSSENATLYIGAIFVLVMLLVPSGLLSIVSVARRLLRSGSGRPVVRRRPKERAGA